MHKTNQVDEQAVKQIGRYLRGTEKIMNFLKSMITWHRDKLSNIDITFFYMVHTHYMKIMFLKQF